MSRRTIFWLVLALVGTLLLAVVGTIVFSLLDKDGAFGLIASVDDEVVAYLTVFGLVFADAIVPIFPGETTLTTASVAASQGKLALELVIVAGALGAVLGDSALYGSPVPARGASKPGSRQPRRRTSAWRAASPCSADPALS